MTETNTTFESKGQEQEQLSIIQKRLDDQLKFIETLKKENFDYREKLRNLENLDTKVDELLNMDRTSQDDTNGKTGQINVNDLKSQGFLTKEDLEKEKELVQKTNNFKEVQKSLIDTYGEDKYLDVLTNRAKELGLSMEEVDRMAQTSPKAALRLFGADKKNTTGTATTSSINTQAFDKQSTTQSAPPKSVMYGATTKDMINSWRQAGEIVKKQLEGNNNATNY